MFAFAFFPACLLQRFLQRNHQLGRWTLAARTEARKKVSQHLRDAAGGPINIWSEERPLEEWMRHLIREIFSIGEDSASEEADVGPVFDGENGGHSPVGAITGA